MKTNFSRFIPRNIILTTELEYNERIRMNEKIKKFSSMFFWEFGHAQYHLAILTYMIDFILINRTVALFHEISTFSHSQSKYVACWGCQLVTFEQNPMKRCPFTFE